MSLKTSQAMETTGRSSDGSCLMGLGLLPRSAAGHRQGQRVDQPNHVMDPVLTPAPPGQGPPVPARGVAAEDPRAGIMLSPLADVPNVALEEGRGAALTRCHGPSGGTAHRTGKNPRALIHPNRAGHGTSRLSLVYAYPTHRRPQRRAAAEPGTYAIAACRPAVSELRPSRSSG